MSLAKRLKSIVASKHKYILSKSGIDTTLGSDSVASSREQLGDTSSVEASLGQTESGTQTSTSSTDYDRVVFMVLRSMSIKKTTSDNSRDAR
jgi:hypothetical protein